MPLCPPASRGGAMDTPIPGLSLALSPAGPPTSPASRATPASTPKRLGWLPEAPKLAKELLSQPPTCGVASAGLRAVSLGSTDSLIQHPAGLTHRLLDPAVREAEGITDGMLRLSVGVEDAEAIWDDLARGLEAAACAGSAVEAAVP